MATTRLLKIRQAEKQPKLYTLNKSISYIMNEKKTENKSLITCYECSAETAATEFEIFHSLYEKQTSNEFKTKDIIAYQIRQSFKPNEITSELAHQLGIELAKEFLKDNNQYIVCTHTDKAHIHNHIIFNAVCLDYNHKFNNYLNTSKEIRNISDKLCKQNNLSVVETKNFKGKHYKEWLEDKKGNSWKSILKNCIDECIEDKECKDFKDFIKLMKNKGYTIKFGKYISFKAENQERFTRGKTLGDYYTENSIKDRIESKNINNSFDLPVKMQIMNKYQTNNKELKDIKKITDLLNFLDSVNIKYYKDINLKIEEVEKQARETKATINKLNDKFNSYSKVAIYIDTYNKYKNLNDTYKSIFNKKKKFEFETKYKSELLSFEFAKSKLDKDQVNVNLDITKLNDKVINLKLKVEELTKDFKLLSNDINSLKVAKKLVDSILNEPKNEKIANKNIYKNQKEL